jgi:hypothetical protein
MSSPFAYKTISDPKIKGSGTILSDFLAMTFSSLCLIHCLFLPVAAAFGPLVADGIGNPLFHKIMVLLAIPTSVYAFWRIKTIPPLSLILVSTGLIGLFSGAFINSLETLETPITVVSALFIMAGHMIRYIRR